MTTTAPTAARSVATRVAALAPAAAKTAVKPASVRAPSLVLATPSRAAVRPTAHSAARPASKPARALVAVGLGSRSQAAGVKARVAQTSSGHTLVGTARKARVPLAPAATRLVRVKALDPCARCGPNTSVEQLYRVEEQVAGTATVHLVFFDRHGWYCVHGASCVAVRDVHAELKAQRVGAGRGR